MNVLNNLLSEGSFIQVSKQLITQLKGIENAVLLTELLSKYYNFKKTNQLIEKNGRLWFFLRSEDIEKELYISYKVQKKIIEFLVKEGLILKKVMGVPAKQYFTINESNIFILVNESSFDQKEELVFTKGNTQLLPKGETYNTNNNILSTNVDKRAQKKSNTFNPPTLEEVIDYFKENGYSEESAKTAFKYYEAGDWHDAKNNKIKRWKQKMIAVWFKDENKIQQSTQQNKLVF